MQLTAISPRLLMSCTAAFMCFGVLTCKVQILCSNFDQMLFSSSTTDLYRWQRKSKPGTLDKIQQLTNLVVSFTATEFYVSELCTDRLQQLAIKHCPWKVRWGKVWNCALFNYTSTAEYLTITMILFTLLWPKGRIAEQSCTCM